MKTAGAEGNGAAARNFDGGANVRGQEGSPQVSARGVPRARMPRLSGPWCRESRRRGITSLRTLGTSGVFRCRGRKSERIHGDQLPRIAETYMKRAAGSRGRPTGATPERTAPAAAPGPIDGDETWPTSNPSSLSDALSDHTIAQIETDPLQPVISAAQTPKSRAAPPYW